MSSVNVQKFKIAHLKPPLLRGDGFAEGEDGEVNNGTSWTPSPTIGVIKTIVIARKPKADVAIRNPLQRQQQAAAYGGYGEL